MFKYVFVLMVIVICFVVLQQGCTGIGERFHKRMEEFRDRRQDRIDDFKEGIDERQERWFRREDWGRRRPLKFVLDSE